MGLSRDGEPDLRYRSWIGGEPVNEDELKTLVREFRASVASDLADQHRRMDAFADELRDRIRTAEVAIVNEIRDLANRLDRRMERIEAQLDR